MSLYENLMKIQGILPIVQINESFSIALHAQRCTQITAESLQLGRFDVGLLKEQTSWIHQFQAVKLRI